MKFQKKYKILIGLIIIPIFLICMFQNFSSSNIASDKEVESLLPDLGLTNPRFRFHMGEVQNSMPLISKVLPNIQGVPGSEWYVAQWGKTEYMRPEVMFTNSPYANDPILGDAVFAFPTTSNQSHLWSFWNSVTNHWVHEIYGENGTLTDVGGANVFLSTDVSSGVAANMDRNINYQFTGQISKASAFFNDAHAQASGAVMAQIFSGFVLHYTDPKTKMISSLFLQIDHANSFNKRMNHRGCYPHNGYMEITLNMNLEGDPRMDFVKNGPGPFYYNINRYLCDVIKKPIQCSDGSVYAFPKEASQFLNWKITSMYIGLETQNRDNRKESKILNAQGSVAAGFQISNLSLLRDNDSMFDITSCDTKKDRTHEPPRGNVDGLSSGRTIYGWAFDPDHFKTTTWVHVYAQEKFIGAVATSYDRPDVRAHFQITGRHGFSFTLPAQIAKGTSIQFYAIDHDKLDSNTKIGTFNSP